MNGKAMVPGIQDRQTPWRCFNDFKPFPRWSKGFCHAFGTLESQGIEQGHHALGRGSAEMYGSQTGAAQPSGRDRTLKRGFSFFREIKNEVMGAGLKGPALP
jgi:hypothetical protein